MHDSSTEQRSCDRRINALFWDSLRYDLKPEQINRTLNSNYFETAGELNSNFKYITA